MASELNLNQRFNRIRFDLLLIIISSIIACTFINLFCLLYVYTFKFIRDFYDTLELKHQLPFLLFEIIVLILMQFFSIYSASKIYCYSDPNVLKNNMMRLVVIWGFLILFMIVIAIQFIISFDEISNVILDDFYSGYYNYYTPVNLNEIKFVNYVQTYLSCCGMENSTDWYINAPPSLSQIDIIPDSCCRKEFNKCNKSDLNQLNIYGCNKAISDWSTKHAYIFLLLWLILILLSLLFFYLLRKISQNEDAQSIVIIKPILSEEENLMTTEKTILNQYQNTFKKCNHQIGFPISTNHNEFNSKDELNLNKQTNKYSQIKYSKVKLIDKGDIDDVELTCHQDDNLKDNCIKLNLDNSIKKDKSINSSIKSIDSSTNNPNYDPNFKDNLNCNTPTSSSSDDDNSSPNLDDDKLLNRNLIHPPKR